MSFTPIEMMICAAARELEDGATVAVGTGGPCAAAMLAQKTQAPRLLILFEAGGVAPQLKAMPISVGDSRTAHRALMATSMADIMDACQKGAVDYAFLGGGQIDAYGNLNSTVIGDYEKPKVRFPGSGGGNDFASFCWRTMVMTPHDPRRFVEKVDFVTSPGYLNGEKAREEAGLPDGCGPYRVITDLAVMGFGEITKRMEVLSLHPGIEMDTVQGSTGFEMGVASRVTVTPPPDDEELRVLREEVDPEGLVIGK